MTPAELQEAIAIATQAVVGEPYVGPTAHNKLARAFLALRAQPSPAEARAFPARALRSYLAITASLR